VVLLAAGVAGAGFASNGAGETRASGGGAPTLPVLGSARPNIVFVLTDDLSMDLLKYMPHVQAMQQTGLTFADYFVSDSLCCPSRSSIFTGNLPHDTHVFNNVGRDGGFHIFHRRGEERHTFAVALQQAGYRTGMMGKYLNGYLQKRGAGDGVGPRYVPPGWNQWDVAGNGYPEFGYRMNRNASVRRFGHRPSAYLTDVLTRKGVNFINTSAATGQPFFLELATFAPHSPYTPAPRDANKFPGLGAPRPPNFDRLPTNPPGWLAGHAPLTDGQLEQINVAFRKRAQAVQAVDRMVDRIQATLAADGLSNDTYLVFSSDNGLHTGEYRLTPGKMTAFDTDIHVPLIVTGPGVAPGRTTYGMSENIDLAKTFAALGGTQLPGDGHSLVPLLHGQHPLPWRNAVVVEHHGPDVSADDPDFQQPSSGSPTTYEAVRTRDFLYVEYADGEREYYNLRSDPYELDNIAGQLPIARLTALHAEVARIENCHDGATCWSAMHLSPGAVGPAGG
jgi:N-acetylglucosamine-6-sulfatase